MSRVPYAPCLEIKISTYHKCVGSYMALFPLHMFHMLWVAGCSIIQDSLTLIFIDPWHLQYVYLWITIYYFTSWKQFRSLSIDRLLSYTLASHDVCPSTYSLKITPDTSLWPSGQSTLLHTTPSSDSLHHCIKLHFCVKVNECC